MNSLSKQEKKPHGNKKPSQSKSTSSSISGVSV